MTNPKLKRTQSGDREPVPSIEINVDAATLTAVVVALLILPLLLTGFLSQ